MDKEKLAKLRKGQVPIYEPGLESMLADNMKAGRISFSDDLAEPVASADLVFLAVGTPMRRGDGYADLSYVFEAAEQLAPHLTGHTVISTKSTVPVGTSREIERRIRAKRPDGEFSVCSNPEFLREGAAISDFSHPDRVLIGADDDKAREVMANVYRPLRLRDTPIMFVSRESAELAKYGANAFLAMKISFINEMADLCEKVGADVQQVATAIGADKRIGDKFLNAGPGYGGSCFPKDVSALVRTAREANAPLSLTEQVEKVNTERKIAMAKRIENAMGGDIAGKTIAMLGVTFKPNTDDMRDAPSLVVIPMLKDRGASVQAYDPKGMPNAQSLIEGVEWRDNIKDVLEGADAAVIMTEWNEFRALSAAAMREMMSGTTVVDLRNVLNADAAKAAGLSYSSIGRS